MSTSEYFIYLLSCWLNDEKPRGSEDTNWQEIYALAEAHNVTAVITSQIKKLPARIRKFKTGRKKGSFSTLLEFSTQAGYQ